MAAAARELMWSRLGVPSGVIDLVGQKFSNIGHADLIAMRTLALL